MARKYRPYITGIYRFDEKLGCLLKEVSELCEDLRPQDRLDLMAACGDAEDAIKQSISCSEIVHVYYADNGKCISMLGLGRQDNYTLGRQIWSVSSNEINKGYVRPLLITEAKKVVGEWADKYGLLQNVVNVDNEKSIHYMEKILGAVFLPEDLKINNNVWKPFYIAGKGGR